MLKQDAVNHFGTQTALAAELGIVQPAVSQWGEVIPEKQAFRLERLTRGVLNYDEALYETTQSAESEAVA